MQKLLLKMTVGTQKRPDTFTQKKVGNVNLYTVAQDEGWEAVEPCFPYDVGTQRCRLPPQLIHTLNVSIGSYILIPLKTHRAICTVFPWKGQKGHCFQADESVTLIPVPPTACRPSNDDGGTRQPLTCTADPGHLPLTGFQVLQVESLKRIRVALVMDKYLDTNNSPEARSRLSQGLRQILATYGIVDGCIVDCSHSAPCRLLKIRFVLVATCSPPLSGSVGKVTSKTVIDISGVMSTARYESLRNSSETAVSLGGLQKPRELLQKLLTCPFRHRQLISRLGISCPKGILLIGPPGTGKTSLVRAAAKDCGASLVYLAGPTICRPQPGESEALLRETFKVARELSDEGPCILFFDDADSVLSSREWGKSAEAHQHGRLLTQVLLLMDEVRSAENLVLVGATNRPDALDPAVRRPGRFDREVYIGVPTKREREQILRVLTAKFPLQPGLDLGHVADWTPGYVGADLAAVCQQIVMSKMEPVDGLPPEKEAPSKDDTKDITEGDFQNALLLVRPSIHRGWLSISEVGPIPWEAIGGLDDVKMQLRQMLEWPMRHEAAFTRFGIERPKGVLLYGPPGCCKTTLVRAAATACHSSFLSIGAAEIYSPYVGDSEKAVAEFFHRGRLGAPAILFLDELDSIVGKRSAGVHRGIHEKVLSALLNEMDGIGIKLGSRQGSSTGDATSRDVEALGSRSVSAARDQVVVVAATNRPDLIDEAILRPGRFDRIIYVPPPDRRTRSDILRTLTRKMPVADVDFDLIVEKTDRFSGADLENLCREAALCALSEDGFDVPRVLHRHFLLALQKTKPSLADDQLHFYDRLQLEFATSRLR